MQFVEKYRIPKKVGEPLILRQKDVVVIPRPYCSPEPTGPKYEQYCRQKLTMHQPFRKLEELLGTSDSHSRAYAQFLQSGAAVPPSLAEDIHRLEMAEIENVDEKDEDDENQGQDDVHRVEDWMLICQPGAEFVEPSSTERDVDWSLAAKAYPDLGEMPSFVAQQRQKHDVVRMETTADPDKLKGKQLEAYI